MERAETHMQSNFHHISWHHLWRTELWLMWSFRPKSKWTRTEKSRERHDIVFPRPKSLLRVRDVVLLMERMKHFIWIIKTKWSHKNRVSEKEPPKQHSRKFHSAERHWNACLFPFFNPRIFFPRVILDHGNTKLAKCTLQLRVQM